MNELNTIVREEEQQRTVVCPQCGNTLAEGQKFCSACGFKIDQPESDPSHESPKAFCCNCGTEISPKGMFCPQCGAKQEQKTPASEVAVKPVEPSVTSALDVKASTRKKSPKARIVIFSLIGAGGTLLIGLAVLFLFLFRTIPVDSLSLDSSSIVLKEGSCQSITCTVSPYNASNSTVYWESNNPSIATVDQYGVITAVSKGSTTITAWADGKSASLDVTVERNLPDLRVVYDTYCDSYWADIGYDGSYLSVDDNPYNRDDYYDKNVDKAIKQIHSYLGLPESLYEEMCQTTWSMGKQHETFEKIGLTVSWTYHPDKGLEITYKLISD